MYNLLRITVRDFHLPGGWRNQQPRLRVVHGLPGGYQLPGIPMHRNHRPSLCGAPISTAAAAATPLLATPTLASAPLAPSLAPSLPE